MFTEQQVNELLTLFRRIADRLDPPPPDIVGTDYPAARLGCTETWIAEQARDGKLPPQCIVPGTGRGRPWKFYRTHIDAWLLTGR
jgi:hypothetical protein